MAQSKFDELNRLLDEKQKCLNELKERHANLCAEMKELENEHRDSLKKFTKLTLKNSTSDYTKKMRNNNLVLQNTIRYLFDSLTDARCREKSYRQEIEKLKLELQKSKKIDSSFKTDNLENEIQEGLKVKNKLDQKLFELKNEMELRKEFMDKEVETQSELLLNLEEAQKCQEREIQNDLHTIDLKMNTLKLQKENSLEKDVDIERMEQICKELREQIEEENQMKMKN